MRSDEDLHADGPEDETPVDVELRETRVGVWDAISKEPPITTCDIDPEEALRSLGRKLQNHYGRNTMRIVHRDKERKGPAANR